MMLMCNIFSCIFTFAGQCPKPKETPWRHGHGHVLARCHRTLALPGNAGFVVTLEFIDVWRFVTANPHALADIAVISVASAFGQTFILLTIKYYGAAVFAALATVRQLVSILVSIALFSHRISSTQILAIALVFVALAAHCFYRWRISRRAARAAADGKQGVLPNPPSMPELHA